VAPATAVANRHAHVYPVSLTGHAEGRIAAAIGVLDRVAGRLRGGEREVEALVRLQALVGEPAPYGASQPGQDPWLGLECELEVVGQRQRLDRQQRHIVFERG